MSCTNNEFGVNSLCFSKPFESCTIQNKYYGKIYQVSSLRLEQEFNDLILIVPNVLILIFGRSFNKNLGTIPRYITELRFGDEYNQSVELLPSHLKCLVFGRNYNLPLVLSKNIENLTIGSYFNQEYKLTKKLLHIDFMFIIRNPIKFSKHLTTLMMHSYCNLTIELPKYITILKIGFSRLKSVIFTSRMTYIEIYLSSNAQMKHFIFEHSYKVIHLKNVAFNNWDLTSLTDNPKKIILHCLSNINSNNEPKNITYNIIRHSP